MTENRPDCPEAIEPDELVRALATQDERVAPLAAHAASCESCARLLAGARALAGELASWEAPEPSGELAARTASRVRLALAFEPATLPALAVAMPGKRSSVELLATWALPGPRPAAVPARARVSFLSVQVAAAVIFFLLSGGFAVTFYPAFVEALEERHVHSCQERLARLSLALRAYRHDHPGPEPLALKGHELRDALVHGGYATYQDLVCPAAHGARPGMVSFELRVPETDEPSKVDVVAWDRFGNHAAGFDIAYADGHTEYVETREFATWLARVRSAR